MDRLEFEILSAIAEKRDYRVRTDLFGYNDAACIDTIDKLEKSELIRNDRILPAGLEALEPYRVKRAVFLAAGFGSRMVPITINTPKPLVRVHGKRIIETMIEAVLAAGISEIYIVRGYLGEQFELLRNKYPMIRFVENPEYDGTGTISSFYYARELLENAYVLESDLVVANPGIIRKYHFSSDFLGTKVEATDDWYFKARNNVITEIGVGGSGDDCYRLIGVSYWDSRDGARLAHDIYEAYHGPDGKKLPMSFVPFRVYRDQYRVSIMSCDAGDVVEIDSFAELQAFDAIYKV